MGLINEFNYSYATLLFAAYYLHKYNVPEEIKVGVAKARKQICGLAESSNAGNF